LVTAQLLTTDKPRIGSVKIRSFTASWEKNGVNILDNINLNIHPGTLVALIGPVAGGKVMSNIQNVYVLIMCSYVLIEFSPAWNPGTNFGNDRKRICLWKNFVLFTKSSSL